MTDDRAEPTNPAASEAPVPEPVSQPSLDEEWAKKFADTVSKSFKKDIDTALQPLKKHIENEDVEFGRLLRAVAEMSADIRLLRDEFRASRTEAIAWNQKFKALSDRVDKHEDLIDGLKKTTGDHAERIERLERTGTYDGEEE